MNEEVRVKSDILAIKGLEEQDKTRIRQFVAGTRDYIKQVLDKIEIQNIETSKHTEIRLDENTVVKIYVFPSNLGTPRNGHFIIIDEKNNNKEIANFNLNFRDKYTNNKDEIEDEHKLGKVTERTIYFKQGYIIGKTEMNLPVKNLVGSIWNNVTDGIFSVDVIDSELMEHNYSLDMGRNGEVKWKKDIQKYIEHVETKPIIVEKENAAQGKNRAFNPLGFMGGLINKISNKSREYSTIPRE